MAVLLWMGEKRRDCTSRTGEALWSRERISRPKAWWTGPRPAPSLALAWQGTNIGRNRVRPIQHRSTCDSVSWRLTLAFMDRFARLASRIPFASGLPAGATSCQVVGKDRSARRAIEALCSASGRVCSRNTISGLFNNLMHPGDAAVGDRRSV
jgi:hypothetical protein